MGEASSAEAHSDEPDPMIGDGDGGHITMLPGAGLNVHRDTMSACRIRIEFALTRKPEERADLYAGQMLCETTMSGSVVSSFSDGTQPIDVRHWR